MKLKFRLIACSMFLLVGGAAQAQSCQAEINSNDQMKFDTASLVVPSKCSKFTVKLKHVGKLPRTAMGHNWVLTSAADFQGATKDGTSAGIANEFIKPGDSRVIAATKLIGGGEEASVTFDVAKLKAGESYTYFCSFPGHWAIMKGTLRVE